MDDLPTSAGAILGCGLVSFTTENSKPDAAKNHLYQILILESVHLVWVLQCERRIRGSDEYDYSEWVVHNRWYRKMNERMQMDCLLTNWYLFEKMALKTKVVHGTWAKCSTNEVDLH